MRIRPERWTRRYCVALFSFRGTLESVCPKDISPALCCFCCSEICDSRCITDNPVNCPYRVNSVIYLGKKLKGSQEGIDYIEGVAS